MTESASVENPYRDCCGGVWSNALQSYMGHFADCKVLEKEESVEKAIEEEWKNPVYEGYLYPNDSYVETFARNVLKRFSEDERRIGRESLAKELFKEFPFAGSPQSLISRSEVNLIIRKLLQESEKE